MRASPGAAMCQAEPASKKALHYCHPYLPQLLWAGIAAVRDSIGYLTCPLTLSAPGLAEASFGAASFLALPLFGVGSWGRAVKDAGSLRLPALASVDTTGGGVDAAAAGGPSAASYAIVDPSASFLSANPDADGDASVLPGWSGLAAWPEDSPLPSDLCLSRSSVKLPALHRSRPRQCLQRASRSFAGQVQDITGSSPPNSIITLYLSSGWLPSHVADIVFPSLEVEILYSRRCCNISVLALSHR